MLSRFEGRLEVRLTEIHFTGEATERLYLYERAGTGEKKPDAGSRPVTGPPRPLRRKSDRWGELASSFAGLFRMLGSGSKRVRLAAAGPSRAIRGSEGSEQEQDPQWRSN